MKWQAEIYISCITVVAIVHPKSATSTDVCTCKLIIALPTNLLSRSELPSWERGAEIINSTQFAQLQDRISNTPECKLELIEVNNGQCGAPNNFNLLEQLVAIVRQLNGSHSNYQCLEIPLVGLPCNDILSGPPVVVTVSFKLSSDELIKDSLNEIVDTFIPTTVRSAAAPISRALFKFMESLNWRKLGIITETGSTYFSHTAESVYIQARDDSSINIITYQQLQIRMNEKINLDIRNASKITLVSASLETTVGILCNAYEGDAVWPKYVWILHSYRQSS
jgi:hypothetical protein